MLLKRRLNPDFDTSPSIQHQYNLRLTKNFIKNKIILDCGCWSGQYTKLAANFAKKAFGIDPNKDAIKFATKQDSSPEYRVGSVLKLPFRKNFFDFIILSEVLEHLPKKSEKKAILEIKRVLQPKGYLMISTPSSYLLSIILDPSFFLINHRHYSKKKILSFLEDDFEIKKIFYTRGIINLFISNIELLYKYLFNKKPYFPSWLTKKLKSEYYKGGFASIYILARLK